MRTFVIGVGMTKFDKPGTKEGDYPDWGKEAGTKALADAGIEYDAIEQAFAAYCYGDSTAGQRALYEHRHHRHPGRQRQQQLLDRLERALPRAPGGQGRARRLRARARLREDGDGLARREVPGPDEPDGQARDGAARAARVGGRAAGAADVRRGRARAHGEVRLRARPLRVDRVEEPQALRQQPVRAVPDRVHARRDQGRARDLLAADEAAVLADERRQRGGRRRVRELRRRQRPLGARGRDRRAVDGDRHALDVRGEVVDRRRRRRHVEEGGRARARGGADRHRRGRRHRAARLLQRERAAHLRGARARGGGRGPQARRRAGDDLRRRRPGRQPVGRPDLEGTSARRDRPRPVHRADLAAARRRRQAPGRRRVDARSSTTSDSAARPS